MNTTLKNKKEIQQAFREILTPSSNEEKIELETLMLMTSFLSEIENVCEERGLLKKDLARMIGTSPSYITQLFRGNKIINLETIAKIMLELNIRFDISLKKEVQEKSSGFEDFTNTPFFRLHDEQGYWVYRKFVKHEGAIDPMKADKNELPIVA